MKIDLAVLRPVHYPCVRSKKFIDFFQSLGFITYLLGAQREKRSVNDDYNIIFNGFYYPYSSKLYLIGTPVYWICTIVRLLKYRPRLIYATDLEGMVPGIIYKILFKKVIVISDIYDNFAARYKVPNFIKRALQAFEELLVNHSDLIILVEEYRKKLIKIDDGKKVIIIPNTPPDYGYTDYPSSRNLKIALTGWLAWHRGVEQICSAAAKIPNAEVLAIGRASAEVKKYLLENRHVKYLGQMSQEQTLKKSSECHVIMAFYEPSSIINIYASPNKLYDAMAIARPIITNSETLISKNIESWDCGFSCAYYDIDKLIEILSEISINPEQAKIKGLNGRKLYDQKYNWENSVKPLRQFLEEIKCPGIPR